MEELYNDFEIPTLSRENTLPVIVVMGATGSGKSYLVNKMAGAQVVSEGARLDSCTQKCQLVPAMIGRTRALLIDTPGFEDSHRSDSNILVEIAQVLASQRALGLELKGVIYLHRITDIRYDRGASQTFEIFKRICGEEAMNNVYLVTTRWNEVDEEVGLARETQLRQDFWAYMLLRGSRMARFYGDRPSAFALAAQLLVKDSVLLRIQSEMSIERKMLNETAAGAFIEENLDRQQEEYQKDLEYIESSAVGQQRLRRSADKSRARLQQSEHQRAKLRRDVDDDVMSEMQQETRKKRDFFKLIPLLAVIINLIGLFVGNPPGAGDILTDFF